MTLAITGCITAPQGLPLNRLTPLLKSPASVSLKSEYISSQHTGLLDALVHEGHGLGDPTKSQGSFEVSFPPAPYSQVLQSNAYAMSSSSSVLGDSIFESSSLDEFQTSKSPSSKCAHSYFNFVNIMAFSGLDAFFAGSKHHADTVFPEKYLSHWADSWRPDASLEASFLNEGSPHSKRISPSMIHGMCSFMGILARMPGCQLEAMAINLGLSHATGRACLVPVTCLKFQIYDQQLLVSACNASFFIGHIRSFALKELKNILCNNHDFLERPINLLRKNRRSTCCGHIISKLRVPLLCSPRNSCPGTRS